MSSMLTEFKDFLMKGNLIELAVAFVMGAAFAVVVNSLVENLVMPVIAMIFGEPTSSLDFTINGAVFRYGAFITDLIQFIAIGLAVFFIVKPVQMALARRKGARRRRRRRATRSAATRSCSPHCAR